MLHTHTHTLTFLCCDGVLTPFDYWLVLFSLEALFGHRLNANMRGHSNQPLFRLCTQNINTSSSLLLFSPFFVYNSAFAPAVDRLHKMFIFWVFVLFQTLNNTKKKSARVQWNGHAHKRVSGEQQLMTATDSYYMQITRRVRAHHWKELLIASIWYSTTVYSIRIQALASFSFGCSTNKRITLVYSFCTK